MPSFVDAEFGEIVVRKRRGTRSVTIKMGTDGRFVATTPFYTPVIYIKQVVNASRPALRKLAVQATPNEHYAHGQRIGVSHTLAVVATGMVKTPTVKVQQKTLLVYLPANADIAANDVQQLIRDEVAKILRREAKAHLPKRLASLASEHGFTYERVRFSHAGGRWGSCSSSGTISLNIALMKLPSELIDYVLIHELCHTRQMNHSPAFWQEVGKYDTHFRLHRRQLKRETPSV